MIQEKTKGIYTLRFFGNVNLSVKTIFLFLSTFGHEQLMSDFFLPTNKALSWARKKSVLLRPNKEKSFSICFVHKTVRNFRILSPILDNAYDSSKVQPLHMENSVNLHLKPETCYLKLTSVVLVFLLRVCSLLLQILLLGVCTFRILFR